jgi:hypothetical protein
MLQPHTRVWYHKAPIHCTRAPSARVISQMSHTLE